MSYLTSSLLSNAEFALEDGQINLFVQSLSAVISLDPSSGGEQLALVQSLQSAAPPTTDTALSSVALVGLIVLGQDPDLDLSATFEILYANAKSLRDLDGMDQDTALSLVQSMTAITQSSIASSNNSSQAEIARMYEDALLQTSLGLSANMVPGQEPIVVQSGGLTLQSQAFAAITDVYVVTFILTTYANYWR